MQLLANLNVLNLTALKVKTFYGGRFDQDTSHALIDHNKVVLASQPESLMKESKLMFELVQITKNQPAKQLSLAGCVLNPAFTSKDCIKQMFSDKERQSVYFYTQSNGDLNSDSANRAIDGVHFIKAHIEKDGKEDKLVVKAQFF